MLGRSYNTALPFAEELASKGIMLSPMASTLLSELLIHSTPVQMQERTVPNNGSNSQSYQQQIESYGNLLQYHTEGQCGALWGASFDDAVNHLSKSLSFNINYIKNTVIPRVIEFNKESTKFIEELGRGSPASELEVCRCALPELIKDESFLDNLRPFKVKEKMKPRNYTLNLDFASAPESFLEVATLSNARLDKLTMEWFIGADMKYLEMAWYSFFAGNKLKNNYQGTYISRDDMESQNLYVRMNVALAYFLIANYYVNHKPDVVVKGSSSELDAMLREHQMYAGTVLLDVLARAVDQTTNDVLVTHVDNLHKKITVNAEVYDKWLATGGNVETILGILVGTKRVYTVPNINKEAVALKAEWDRYTRVHLEGIEYRKAKTLRDFYHDLLRKYLGNDYMEDLERNQMDESPSNFEKIMSGAKQWLSKLSKEQLLDERSIAVKLIAGFKYHFTNAEKFIEDMRTVGSFTDEATPEEEAFIATVNYIVDFVQGQLLKTQG